MTQPDIQLSTADVRQHARMVDQAADMCRDAVAAARHIELHDEVYGVLFGELAARILNPRNDAALETMRNRAQATTDLADLLRVMADEIDGADSRAEQRQRKAGRK